MKLYIVRTSKGTWDSYESITIGIYTTLEKAEQGKEEFLINKKNYEQKYTEERSNQLEKESGIYEDKEWEEMPQYIQEYMWWESWMKYDKEEYSTTISIEEVYADKILYKFENA